MFGRKDEEDHLEEFGGVEDSLHRGGRYVDGGEFEFDVVAARQHGDARVLESVVRHEVFGRDAPGGYEEREDGEVVCDIVSCSFLALGWCVDTAVVAAGGRDISCSCLRVACGHALMIRIRAVILGLCSCFVDGRPRGRSFVVGRCSTSRETAPVHFM